MQLDWYEVHFQSYNPAPVQLELQYIQGRLALGGLQVATTLPCNMFPTGNITKSMLLFLFY